MKGRLELLQFIASKGFTKGVEVGTNVIKAVDEFVRLNNYKLEVTDWDDENPIQDERQPNWYFIKR